MISVANLVERIAPLRHLPQPIPYLNPRNPSLIRVEEPTSPSGPIPVRRWNPTKGEREEDASTASISQGMLRRMATAIKPEVPFSVDRVLGASYNVRSVLESLLAHTEEFYVCHPGRIEIDAGNARILAGHKHLVYMPGQPHSLGEVLEIDSPAVVFESPGSFHVYEGIQRAAQSSDRSRVSRIGLDVLLALNLSVVGARIGAQVHCHSEYELHQFQSKSLNQLEGYVGTLETVPLFVGFPDALRFAGNVDCLWFWGKGIVAAFQICDESQVREKVQALSELRRELPPSDTRWVIVVPSDQRDRVRRKIEKLRDTPPGLALLESETLNQLFFLFRDRMVSGVRPDLFIGSFLTEVPHEVEDW